MENCNYKRNKKDKKKFQDKEKVHAPKKKYKREHVKYENYDEYEDDYE